MKSPWKKGAALAALIVLATAPTAAAEEKKYAAPSTFNGARWRGLSNISTEHAQMFKICLLRGVYEGAYSVDGQNAFQQYGPWVSFSELAESIDRFYADDNNLKIPVTYAIVLSQRPSGTPLSTMDRPPLPASGALVSMEHASE